MTAPDIDNLVGHTAVDRDGDKIGKIGQVYLDDATQQPVWITVSTGFFGSNESFAPLYGATHVGDDLQLGVDKAQVKDAPNVDADGQLSEAETDALYAHYAGYLRAGGGRAEQVEGRSRSGRSRSGRSRSTPPARTPAPPVTTPPGRTPTTP